MRKKIEAEPFAISLSDPSIRGFSTSETDPQNMTEEDFAAYGDPLRGNISANSVREMVEEVLHCLTARERRVLHLRWGLDGRARTQKEVGQEIGRSRWTAGRIEKRAISKLKVPNRSRMKDYLPRP